MALTLAEYRQKYPQYDTVDDDTLAKSLHSKYYPDMDFGEFSSQIQYGSAVESVAQPAQEPTTPAQAPEPNEYRKMFEGAAQRHGHPVDFVDQWSKWESGHNPQAVSKDDAKGMLQLLDQTSTEMGVQDPFDPAQNIEGGAGYLRKKIDEFGGDVEKGIAAYHSGATNVRRAVAAGGDNWVDELGPEGQKYTRALYPIYTQSEESQSDIERAAAEAALYEDPMARATGSGGGFLGLASKKTPEERLQSAGDNIQRMTELGIYGPERYGMTQEQIDKLASDRIQQRILEAKAAGKESDGATAGVPVDDGKAPDEFRTWHNFYVEAIGNMDDQIVVGYQMNAAMNARIKAQELSLGALYYQNIATKYDDLSDKAKGVIKSAAQTYGMSTDEYVNFTAAAVDTATDEEQEYLDEYNSIIKQVQSFKPKSADETWTGHMAAMAIENMGQLGYIMAGAATGSPLLTMSLMGTDIYARTYANARAKGRDEGDAIQDAFVSALIEGATEGIPVSKFANMLRRGKKVKAGEMLVAIGTEAAQEVLAEAGQLMYDTQVIGEETTWGEAFAQLRDAGVLGAFMGTVVTTPAIASQDMEIKNLDENIETAKKELKAVAIRVMDPANRGTTASRAEAKVANDKYVKAIRAKRELILKRKEAEAEAKKAKVEKKEAKRKAKLTPLQAKRETAQEKQRTRDQALKHAVTDQDLIHAEVIERAGEGALNEEDADVLNELLDIGYMKVTKAGTPIVLPAGKARAKAVREAQEAPRAAVVDEVIEPIPFDTPEQQRRAAERSAAVDEEIGRRLRGEPVPAIEEPAIKPTPYVSPESRKKKVSSRVRAEQADIADKIADKIVKAEQEEEAYEEQQHRESQRIEANMNVSYEQAIQDQNEIDAEVALNLARLDQKNAIGYKGTRIGDVLRAAEQRLKKAADKARSEMDKKFWSEPVQGQLFDVTGVLIKGTAEYAKAVKVGAFKLAQHGAKYSAWAADMIGEFGDSIRPVLSKIYHDAKKNVANVLKWSHEKHAKGPEKGRLKFAPKQYAGPGAIRSLRRILKKLATEGEAGRFWYEKTGKAIRQITGVKASAYTHHADGSITVKDLDTGKSLGTILASVSPEVLAASPGIQSWSQPSGKEAQHVNEAMNEARKLAGLLAIYSSGTGVGPNLTNALKMWAIYSGNKGKRVKQGTLAGRFSEQDRTAMEWLESEASDEYFVDKFGDKRFPFFTNIMRAVDPDAYEYGQGVTIDMWIMRALGYDRIVPTDAQFAFGAVELRMLAQKLGWERQQVQAAVWVSIKARWEFIQKKAKARSVKEGLAEFNPGPKGTISFDVIGVDRNSEIANEKKIIAVFREEALKASVGELQAKLDQSKRDFSDFLEANYATISWEAEPSTSLGLIFNSMPIEEKIALQHEVSALLTNPKTGREFLAEWLGLLGQDQFQGPGVWDGAVGAVTQNKVLAPLQHKASHEKVKTVQEESKTALDGYSAILGFLLKQDAVAWHRPFYSQTLKVSNGVGISIPKMSGKKLNRAVTKLYASIIKVAEEHGYDFGLEWAPIALEGEIRVLNFSNVQNREFHKIIQEAADRAKVGGDMEVFQSDGNLVMNDWKENPNGEEYEQAINQSKDPKVKDAFERAKRQFTKRLDAIYAKYAEKYEAQRQPQINVARVDEGKKPAKLKKGFIRFRHFGKKDVKTLKTEFFGTGIRGAEGKRGSEQVISAYPDKGFKKEVGLGQYEYIIDVSMKDMYNANEDPMGLKDSARLPDGGIDMHKYEKSMKAAGYVGYYVPDAGGNLKGQARFFQDLTVGNMALSATLSSPEPPKVIIRENSLDELEVREKNGEIYYAADPEDAISTARHIYGKNITIEFQDEYGDIYDIIKPVVEKVENDITKARRKRDAIDKKRNEEEDWDNHKQSKILEKDIRSVRHLEERIVSGPEGAQEIDLADDDAVKARFQDWLFRGTFDKFAEFDMDSPSAYKISRSESFKATPQRLLEQFRSMQSQRDEMQTELDSLTVEPEVLSEETIVEFGQRNPLIPSADLELAFEEFFDEWMEVTEDNPLSPDERVFEYGSAITLRPSVTEGVVWLDSIRSFEKGTGAGSQALKYLTEMADRHGITLRLYARPFETEAPGLEQESLIMWYEQNGFAKEFSEQMGEHSYRMTRLPMNGDRTFSRFSKQTEKAGFGLPVDQVQGVVNAFMNVVGIDNIVVVETVEGLPKVLYDQAVYHGLTHGIQGVYHDDIAGRGPTIYIVASNLIDGPDTKTYGRPSVRALQTALLHETFGHFGLQALLGVKKYNQTMDAIIKAFPSEVKRRALGLGAGRQSQRMAAEEVFAYMVQEELLGLGIQNVKLSIIDKVIIEIQQLLVRLGWKKMSRNDMLNLMFRSVDFVKSNTTETIGKRARKVEKYRISKIYAEASGINGTYSGTFSLGKARREDPDLDRFLNKIGHGKTSRLVSLRNWWELRKDNLARAAEIEIFDQFAGIRHAEKDLGLFGDESGYISVRLTAGSDVVIRSALENSVPVWDIDGSVRMKANSEGLIEILSRVSHNAEMLKMFEAFVVARRAKRLKKEDREKLLERAEIGAVLKYVRKNKLYKLFKQTADEMAGYKKEVLDFAQEAGLIDKDSRKLWEHHDHVPFYRVLSGDRTGPLAASRLGKAKRVIHRLRGSTDTLKNPLDSIVENLGMLIEASMKNKAMQQVIENFNGTGIVTKAPQAEMSTALIPLGQVKDMLHEAGVALDQTGDQLLSGIRKLTSLQAPTADNIISVLENGQRKYYYVHDTGVMRGLDNVSPKQWTSLMKFLRAPKRWLTLLITRMPDFIIKNWFRDMWHAMVLQRHGQVIPILDSAAGWARAITEDAVYKDVLSGGGVFDSGYVNASDPERAHTKIRRALIATGFQGRFNVLDSPRKLGRFYMRLANGAENAHRLVVYQKALKKTGSRKQALFESRDLMDFSMRGANGVVRFLAETVPFWGARVQGIQRTGKAFAENPTLTVARAMPIVLATLALYARNRDDDRYKGLNDYDKRMYYHFFDVFEPSDHWRLPKPFEVGAIFSTFPEIMMELTLSDEPDRGKVAAKAIYWTVTEMLSVWPSVQAVMPPIELAVNRNLFTDAPILTEWEKGLDPKDQYGHRTNKTVKALAQSMPESAPSWAKSPKQLEHLIRGYLGSAMDYTLVASDLLYQTATQDPNEPPTMRWDETPFMKAFRRDAPAKYDRYTEGLYDVLEAANKIHNSINRQQKERTPESEARIKQLREENIELLYARGPLSNAATAMRSINAQIRNVYANEKLSPSKKRERIDALFVKKSKIAKKAFEYRPGGKRNKYSEKVDESFWERFIGMTKGEQVDELISQSLPHTATLINDMTISNEKLKEVA